MFKKLRNQMLLFNIITISLVIVVAFSVVYFATYNKIEHENKRRLQAMSMMPLRPNRPFPGGGIERSFALEKFGADYRVSFVLFAKNGELKNINSHLDFEDSVYKEALGKIGKRPMGKITLGGRRWAYMISLVSLYGQNQYEQIVFLDITNGIKTLRALLITLTGVGFAALLVLFWFSYYFAARAVRPIEESYYKQRQFVADASHEFKTPLAIISANIDAIEASAKESVESQKEWFGYIRAELQRSTKLVDNLLYLAESENVNLDGNAPFNLSHACETVCASLEAVLYETGISLDTKIKGDIIVPSDGEKITQVLYILLDNAGKYTPRHGRIMVSLGLEQEWAVLRVSNTGQGIAAGDMSKIFDRFYRPDVSRSQETGGFGLGLSIAKTIIERCGGEISGESGESLTTFMVRLRVI
jgi:two-component system sensor histidine kinase CiaH